MRVVARSMLLALAACGGSVTVSPEGDQGSTSGQSSGGADAGVADSSAGDAGHGWTVSPGQTFSYVSCKESEMTLFAEIWPSGSECVPVPGLIEVLVIGISGWDGEPGTYTVGEVTSHGTAGANLSPLPEEDVQGTITVEPFVAKPGWVSWKLSVGEGRTDLGLCGLFDDFPCRGR